MAVTPNIGNWTRRVNAGTAGGKAFRQITSSAPAGEWGIDFGGWPSPAVAGWMADGSPPRPPRAFAAAEFSPFRLSTTLRQLVKLLTIHSKNNTKNK
jgi:hypothetical protein